MLIWTTFWTRGTIFELLIVKGVHQWSYRKKILRYPQICQSYRYFSQREKFLKIWNTFWTRGTIFEQLIVKGVHQWSCRGKKFEGTLKFARVIAIFLSNKISQNLEQNFETKIFELKMAITQSILKILRSSFLQTLPFL